MYNFIEIKPNVNKEWEVDLPKLLNAIESTGGGLYWSIFYLEAVGDLGDGKSLGDLEEEIKSLPSGMNINWKQLNELAEKFHYVLDLVLVGNNKPQFINRNYETDRVLFQNSQVVIQMIDGHLWQVYSADDTLIEYLAKIFRDTECLNVSSELKKSADENRS